LAFSQKETNAKQNLKTKMNNLFTQWIQSVNPRCFKPRTYGTYCLEKNSRLFPDNILKFQHQQNLWRWLNISKIKIK